LIYFSDTNPMSFLDEYSNRMGCLTFAWIATGLQNTRLVFE